MAQDKTILNNFKTKELPIKNLYKIITPEPTVFDTLKPIKSKRKKSPLKLSKSYVNQIENDKKI